MENEKTGGAALGVGILAWLASSAAASIVTMIAFAFVHGIVGYARGGLACAIAGTCIGLWWKKNPEIGVGKATGRAICVGIIIGGIVVAAISAPVYLPALSQ